MTRVATTFLLLIICSVKSFSQLDFSFSVDALKTQHLIHYYQFYETGKFMKSDNAFKSFSGATFYLKYNFLKGSHTGMSIGIPYGFDFGNSGKGDGLIYQHYHLMLDMNTGCYKYGFRDERVSKFGFYFGVGVGFLKSGHLPTYTSVTSDQIPVGTSIKGIDTASYANNRMRNEKLLESFGVMAHLGVTFNYYGYHNPYMFLLPTGLRMSFHQAVDKGGSFYTLGLLYNTKVLYPAICSLTRSKRNTKRLMSM